MQLTGSSCTKKKKLQAGLLKNFETPINLQHNFTKASQICKIYCGALLSNFAFIGSDRAK